MLLSHLLFLSLMCVTVNGLGEVRGTFTCRRNSEAGATTPHADAPTTKVGATTTKAGTTTNQAGATTNQAGATTNKAGATTTKAGTTTNQAGTTTNKAEATTTNVEATTTEAGTTTTKAGATTNKAGATTTKAEATTTNVEATTTKAGTTTTKAGATTTNVEATTTKAGATTTKAGAATTKAGAATTNVEATTTKAGATTTKAGTTTTKAGAATTNVEATTTKASTNYNGACSSMSIIDGSLTDCRAIYRAGCNKSGIYNIKPSDWPEGPFEAYCDMETLTVPNLNSCAGHGWTVFQRRVNGFVDFNRNWTSYKDGFGQLDHEFWLGNEKLHYLTKKPGTYRLRIDLVSSSGTSYHACYSEFHIQNENGQYMLHVSEFRDTNSNFDVFRQPGNRKFSACGRDNRNGASMHCNALMGGWWHRPSSNGHSEINLNGDYSSLPIPNVGNVSIKSTEMKIRPE